jgi:glycosyltransferase involved in cell wall biosynthesis
MKDHETFLLAAAIVLGKSNTGKSNNVRFACIGGGGSAELGQRMAEFARELGIADRVMWLQPIRDMRAVYSACDLICVSSRFGEGFPNVLGEAMACERPCVATNVGDAAYVLGSAGPIVPRRNPEALAAAILKQLSGETVNAAGRLRICQNFTVEHLVNSTESVLLSRTTHSQVAAAAV